MDSSREDSQQSLESHEDDPYMSDGGYDDDDDDMPVAALPVHTEVTVDELAAEQAEQIGQVAALLEVPLVSASVLLRTFQWNTEKLIEQFYEDRERVLEKAGDLGQTENRSEFVELVRQALDAGAGRMKD